MAKNKIALINPPSPFLTNQRVFPNLGLLDLATAQRHIKEDVSVVDLCGSENPEEEIKKISTQFDIFGFSSTTPQFIEVYKLHRILKKANPNARTIIGGAHPSSMYSVLQAGYHDNPNIHSLEEFDHIVAGEGEGLNLNDIQKGWVVAPLIKDINHLQISDRSLMDIKSYKYFLNGEAATTLMTQRGCPFSCTFCCGREVDMYRKVRSKSAEKVIEELDYLHNEFGFSAFMWFDDEININPSRLITISKKLQKRDYIHRGFVRSDLLVKHPETLDALIDAGFVELCSGVESGDGKILQRINKGTTPKINSQAAQMIMGRGLKYKAFTIIGHPGETYKDIERTTSWLKENKPHGFDVTILSPYPGSIIYDHSKPSKKYKGFDREWNGLFFKQVDFSSEKSFYKGNPGNYFCNTRTEELTSKDLLRIRDKMEKDIRKQLQLTNNSFS